MTTILIIETTTAEATNAIVHLLEGTSTMKVETRLVAWFDPLEGSKKP